jgi:membrane protease subunit (stomatin/prohibitin family)
MGTPTPNGGSIYPFSVNPIQRGARREKKLFNRAKVACISSAFNLKIFWGTKVPFTMADVDTNKAFKVGARGTFYVNIDPTDAARMADRFYSKCLSHRNANLFDTEALRDFLRDAFIMEIGAAIERYVTDQNRPISDFKGLTPTEILAVSKELYPIMKDIFKQYGLTVAPSSERSILEGLKVDEI